MGSDEGCRADRLPPGPGRPPHSLAHRPGPAQNGREPDGGASQHRFARQTTRRSLPRCNRGTTGATFRATLMPGPVRKLVALFAALLMAGLILVLLIGCANAANVLLA